MLLVIGPPMQEDLELKDRTSVAIDRELYSGIFFEG
jgi:hypothetical protein